MAQKQGAASRLPAHNGRPCMDPHEHAAACIMRWVQCNGRAGTAAWRPPSPPSPRPLPPATREPTMCLSSVLMSGAGMSVCGPSTSSRA